MLGGKINLALKENFASVKQKTCKYGVGKFIISLATKTMYVYIFGFRKENHYVAIRKKTIIP